MSFGGCICTHMGRGLRVDQEELQVEELKFLGHVDSRWSSLLPALEWVQCQRPYLRKYFLEFLPNHKKRSTGRERFKRINLVLSKEEQVLKVEMDFLQSVKPVLDQYLTILQNQWPMIHVLYTSIKTLLETLLGRFVRPGLVQNKSAQEHFFGRE